MSQIIALLAGLIPSVALLVYIGTHPDVAEKWFSIFGRAISHIPGLWARGSKQYAKHDTQQRLNQVTKKLASEGPFLTYEKAEIEWVSKDTDLGALAAQGKIIVRLNAEEQQDRGFIRAAMCFVQESLLRSAKQSLNASQRVGLNLFIVRSVLRSAHPDLLEIFDEEFLGMNERGDLVQYHSRFSLLESRGLLWDVFLQELVQLEQRTRFELQRIDYSSEVEDLLTFLVLQSNRSIGQLVRCEHISTLFRVGLVYIGIPHKRKHGPDLWVDYILSRLTRLRIDSVYLISLSQQQSLIEKICVGIEPTYVALRHAIRSYSIVRKTTLEPVEGSVTVLQSSAPFTPLDAAALAAIEDEGDDALEDWDAEEEVLPLSRYVPVEVVRIGANTGLVRTEEHDVHFLMSAVDPIALPLAVGRKGLAMITKAQSGRLEAAVLRLEAAQGEYLGTVAMFSSGYGWMNVDSGGPSCRFQVRDWAGSGRITRGMRVRFGISVTPSGNYRAIKVREA